MSTKQTEAYNLGVEHGKKTLEGYDRAVQKLIDSKFTKREAQNAVAKLYGIDTTPNAILVQEDKLKKEQLKNEQREEGIKGIELDSREVQAKLKPVFDSLTQANYKDILGKPDGYGENSGLKLTEAAVQAGMGAELNNKVVVFMRSELRSLMDGGKFSLRTEKAVNELFKNWADLGIAELVQNEKNTFDKQIAERKIEKEGASAEKSSNEAAKKVLLDVSNAIRVVWLEDGNAEDYPFLDSDGVPNQDKIEEQLISDIQPDDYAQELAGSIALDITKSALDSIAPMIKVEESKNKLADLEKKLEDKKKQHNRDMVLKWMKITGNLALVTAGGLTIGALGAPMVSTLLGKDFPGIVGGLGDLLGDNKGLAGPVVGLSSIGLLNTVGAGIVPRTMDIWRGIKDGSKQKAEIEKMTQTIHMERKKLAVEKGNARKKQSLNDSVLKGINMRVNLEVESRKRNLNYEVLPLAV